MRCLAAIFVAVQCRSGACRRFGCHATAAISAKIACAAAAFFKENETAAKNVMQYAVLRCFAATCFIGNYAEFNSLSAGLTAMSSLYY